MNISSCKTLLRRNRAVLTSFALAATTLTSAHAGTINVVNGGFEQTTYNFSSEIGSTYQKNGVDVNDVTGWSSNGLNLVYLPGTASTTGAASQFGYQYQLWGPGNGSANGLTGSPDGGNFIAMDGAYEVGGLSQMIFGLTPGALTTVSFYYAGAQQSGYNGATTEAFNVTLGGQTLETPILSDLSHGFTGWQYESLTFTATSANELLTFAAAGTPNGVPPMSLLDSVSISTAPEPNSLVFMATGLVSAAGFLRRRYKKATV